MSLKLTPKYIKTEDQRDAFIFVVFAFFFGLYVTTYEINLIPPNLQNLFMITKYSTVVITMYFAILVTIKPTNQKYIFMAALGSTLYSIIGEYFSPLYHYAFVMCMLAISILFRPKAKLLIPFVVIGQIPIIYIQYLKKIGHITHAREAVLQDYIMISIEFAIILIAIFDGYSKRRRKEIQHRERFAIIGQDLNVFAHNIKSMLATQFILVDNIQENIEQPEELKELLQTQEKNLTDIKNYMNDFNLLEKSELEETSLKSSVNKACKLLSIPRVKIEFKIIDEVSLKCIQQDLDSILINILSNAKKAVMKEGGQIEVEINKNELIVRSPITSNYEPDSGIGETLTVKLAQKNDLKIVVDQTDREYIVKLKY